MDTKKTETGDETEEKVGEGDTISVSKSEYEKMNQTLGALKRELKDLKKAKEETPKETPTNQKPDDALLQKQAERLEKLAFKQHEISHEDDIELARKTAKKWGMDVEDVLGDEDFKVKLEKQQTSRSNVLAASGRGGANHGTNVKNSPDYWLAQGRPPTPEEVPDLNARSEILGALMEAAKKGDGSKFFQDFKPQV